VWFLNYQLRLNMPDLTCGNWVQIDTGTSALLYSVRLRDRGLNTRGFVQLPTVVDDDGNVAAFPIDPSVLSQAARCYIVTCPCANLLNSSVTGMTTYNVTRDCSHIRAAIACTTDAEPLTIDPSVVDSLPTISDDVRTILRHFVANDSCPVIQRVTRSVLVVRSQPTYDCSLEFVHVTFADSARSHSGDVAPTFVCDCRVYQVSCVDFCLLHLSYFIVPCHTLTLTEMLCRVGKLRCLKPPEW